MKKIVSLSVALFIVAALAVALAFGVFAETGKGFAQIIDLTGTLTEDQIAEYESRLVSLKNSYAYDAAIVLINNDTLDEYNITSLQDFADDMYDEGDEVVSEIDETEEIAEDAE